MFTLEDIQNKNLIAYKHIRGSHLYNLNVEGSDIDIGGVYVTPHDIIMSFDKFYQPQISDATNDTTFYEVKRWLELLCQSNPNVLESLFCPEDKILHISPIMDPIFANRNMFLTKQCFKSFYGYATEQIKRARGLNKKMVNPVHEKKGVIDFCYTTYNQGSTHIMKILNDNGLKQEFCGLAAVPNMHDMYAVFYDWGAHFASEGISVIRMFNGYVDNNTLYDLTENIRKSSINIDYLINVIGSADPNDLFDFVEAHNKPEGYRGIVAENSLDVRLSSVKKGEKPICHMSFNKDGYAKHCRQYTEYKDWEKNRNQLRYESNLNKNYDSKNMMHTIRLMHQAYEIACGQGLNLDRSHERDFLIDIRNHKFEYDELISYCDAFKIKMKSAMASSTIPDFVNINDVNDILLDIRKRNTF